MNKTILVACALALASLTSVAAAADDSWYIRGEVGRSDISANGVFGNSSDTAASVRAGYYFTHNFAVEGSYSNFGNRSDGFGNELGVDGWGLGVVGKQNFGPDGNGFFIQGRAGIARVTTDVKVAGVKIGSDNSTKGYVGAGLGYDFSRNVGISANYDYTGAGAYGFGGHVSSWTGGLEVRF